MKRQIKFRGKTLKGEWPFGYYLEFELCDGEGRCSYIKKDGCQPIKVIPETIGQFTGFTDIEGTDVYEDDIVLVELKSWHTGEVIVSKMCKVGFEKGCFGLCGYGHNGAFERFCNFVESLVSFKIVGNSHDNPELLEGGKE